LQIQTNGETHEVPDGLSLLDLISSLGLSPERLAIELNGVVVRRAEWPLTHLQENDRVEIVHFVGGGQGASTAAAEVRKSRFSERAGLQPQFVASARRCD
jgi:thiamine biosynthesis protein ThiS